MKKIGIIGGLGPESTLDYYKEIISAFNTDYKELAYPEILICSANLNQLIAFVDAADWDGFADWLVEKVRAVHSAGAEFAAIASNTPHIVFDQVEKRSPIPLLSIVDETRKTTQKEGFKTVGLLGTKLTMESDFFKAPFIKNGITVITPNEEEQKHIHQKLFTEIELGIFKESTRDSLLKIIERMKNGNQIEAVILGCTELPLILTEEQFGIRFLNTTKIHCESIVDYCIN